MGLLTAERGGLKRTPEFIDFPELHDDEREIRETLGFHKGLVSFDIVFDADGTPFVLEIQSTNSGLNGIASGLANDPRVSDDVKQFAAAHSRNETGYSNPDWFNNVAERKDEQLAFIPEENRPRSVVDGDFDWLFKFGKVIIKPLSESQGKGIRIFDKGHAREAQAYAAEVKNIYGSFMAQSFIESRGADLAPQSLRGHAASLRLIIPFEVIDGKPVITVEGVGYQRVAPEAMPGSDSENAAYEKGGVVNYHRSAHAVPMSEAEYQRALPVVMNILGNLINHGERSEAYRRDYIPLLQSRVYDVWNSIRNSLTCGLVNVKMHTFKSIEEILYVIRFLRFVERELSLLGPEIREGLAKRKLMITISHISGTRGTIRVFIIKSFGSIDTTIEFTTLDSPGVLFNILRDVADGKQPKK